MSGDPRARVAVCVKWVAGLPEPGDDRFAGISAADQAAVELALRHGEATSAQVAVITAGPAQAERALRDVLACGASLAVRIDQPLDVASAEVARQIAAVIRSLTATTVWCGDYSPDRGSASVPAFVAAELGFAQALGAVDVLVAAGPLIATRRLDGGRREVVRLDGPAVVSVEGAAARLRRASLSAVLAARRAPLDVRPGSVRVDNAGSAQPYRPRARALPAPTGDTALARLRQLTDSAGAPARGETVELEPAAAAERILLALRDWGYLLP